MTFLSFAAIILAGAAGLRVLCQRQELDQDPLRGTGAPGRVEAGAVRAPYDWAVDNLEFAEFWADYETKRRLEEHLA